MAYAFAKSSVHRPSANTKTRVGVLLDLADIRSVVLHVQRHPELLDDLAAVVLEGLLEAARDLPSEGVVERDDRDLLIAEHLGRVLAERMHVAAGREARSDQPLGPLALGEVVGGVDRVDRRDLLSLDVRHERVRHVGEDNPGQHVDLVAFDQLPCLRNGDRRLALVVFEDYLELPAGDLPTGLLPVKLAAIVHVLSRLGDGTRDRRDEADLDRVLCNERRRLQASEEMRSGLTGNWLLRAWIPSFLMHSFVLSPTSSVYTAGSRVSTQGSSDTRPVCKSRTATRSRMYR